MFNPYREIRDSIRSRKINAQSTIVAVARSWAGWCLGLFFAYFVSLCFNAFDADRPYYYLSADNFSDLIVVTGYASLLIIGVFYVGVSVHELGHVIAGCCFGKQPLYFRLGKGPDVETGLRVFGVPIRVGLYPLEGRVEYGEKVRSLSPWQLRIISIAGPLASIALAVIAWHMSGGHTQWINSIAVHVAVGFSMLAVPALIPVAGSDVFLFFTGTPPPMDLRDESSICAGIIEGVILRGYNMRFRSEKQWTGRLRPLKNDADLSDSDVTPYYRMGTDGRFREFYGDAVPPGVTIYEEVEVG